MNDQNLKQTIAEITDSDPEHKTASVIKYVGLALFVAGLMISCAALTMNNYQLTAGVLQKTITNQSQRAAVQKAWQPNTGKIYNTEFPFIHDLRGALKKANDQLKKQNKINPYQQKELRMYITKAAGTGFLNNHLWLIFGLTFGVTCLGALIYIVPRWWIRLPGIQNDHIYHNPVTRGRVVGLIMGSFLIVLYVLLYWAPAYLANWIRLVDPISFALSGQQASQWFFYGFMYTLAVLVMGVRMFIKYRHSNYHLIRTASLIFFQTAFAFLIPQILIALNKPSYDFKNIWPLNYEFFFNYKLHAFTHSGSIGLFMLFWGIALIIIGVPVITYFYGKRWYCSWVCGCGGLAETFGDPHRQLSDKSLGAWQIERWLIHSILVFVVVMTAGVLYSYFSGNGTLLGISTYSIRSIYGFVIGSIFSGVIGVGFYPFMGNRVWCRFGCPLAAYLGIVQRFKSRFRITTNGGQCISCGNCSTYCEMGIDVRWYAQRGQNIVRASCVGCGVCASVCPRGVLRLENGPEEGRFNEPKAFTITDDGIEMNDELVA
ncbi:MAG TPA: 4Fe-4S dicluster domain-containing protein [Balneolaceae bacterium]|nr:4Fe-4S dicluster domain-containing protein [Balneolaceae bacterium]